MDEILCMGYRIEIIMRKKNRDREEVGFVFVGVGRVRGVKLREGMLEKF